MGGRVTTVKNRLYARGTRCERVRGTAEEPAVEAPGPSCVAGERPHLMHIDYSKVQIAHETYYMQLFMRY